VTSGSPLDVTAISELWLPLVMTESVRRTGAHMAVIRNSLKLNPTAAAFAPEEGEAVSSISHSALPQLEASLEEVVIYLDPFLVQIPDTPNRLPDAFEDEAFEVLRLGIQSGGSNVDAIGVRRVFNPEGGWIYVLVFGERRLRACREAGLKVRAVVREITDSSVDYLDRMRENSGRADLAPIEFAIQVQHMIDGPARMKKIELSSKLGISLATISRAYDLACLPPIILQAFVSAREIRYRDLKALKDAWAQSPDAVAAESNRIQGETERVGGPEVVKRITSASKGAKDELAPCKLPDAGAQVPLLCGGVEIGSWSNGAGGVLQLQVQAAMSDAQRAALLKHVSAFIEKKVLLLPTKGLIASGEAAV